MAVIERIKGRMVKKDQDFDKLVVMLDKYESETL